MLSFFARSTINPVASCSYKAPVKYLHSNAGHKGLRSRNWQTASAYPAPTPLMSKALSDGDEPVGFSEEAEPSIPRMPLTKLKGSKRQMPEEWKRHRAVLKEAYPNGWSPPKKLSREAMDGLRILHAQNPDVFTTPILASKFRISPEAVRRILKSKWEPTRERRQQLAERERMEIQERSRKAYLEEVKSRIETIAAKKLADQEESKLYWSRQPPEKRVEAERRNHRHHGVGYERQDHRYSAGKPPRPVKSETKKDNLFFSWFS